MILTSSLEDYLEAILIIQQNHGYVRCTDVADHLKVKKTVCKPGGKGTV